MKRPLFSHRNAGSLTIDWKKSAMTLVPRLSRAHEPRRSVSHFPAFFSHAILPSWKPWKPGNLPRRHTCSHSPPIKPAFSAAATCCSFRTDFAPKAFPPVATPPSRRPPATDETPRAADPPFPAQIGFPATARHSGRRFPRPFHAPPPAPAAVPRKSTLLRIPAGRRVWRAIAESPPEARERTRTESR